MAALTESYEAYERPGLVVNYPLAAAKRIWKGALVGVDANGYVNAMDHATAGLIFVGVAGESVDNSAGAAGAATINVTKAGAFAYKAASGFTPAQADVGSDVYANSDWEVQVATTGLTNQYKVGAIAALETTSTAAAGVRIRIDAFTK